MSDAGITAILLLAIIVVPIICGAVCFLIARSRKLTEPGWWFFVGAILGPLAWIAAALWPKPRPAP